MSNNLGNVIPISDASFVPPQRDAAAHAAKTMGQEYADVRLVIEEDQATGAFIYKTMDRRTGQVIQQFPREQILRLKQEQEYAAGAIIDARA